MGIQLNDILKKIDQLYIENEVGIEYENVIESVDSYKFGEIKVKRDAHDYINPYKLYIWGEQFEDIVDYDIMVIYSTLQEIYFGEYSINPIHMYLYHS